MGFFHKIKTNFKAFHTSKYFLDSYIFLMLLLCMLFMIQQIFGFLLALAPPGTQAQRPQGPRAWSLPCSSILGTTAVPGPGLTWFLTFGKVSSCRVFLLLQSAQSQEDPNYSFKALSFTSCSKSTQEQLRMGWPCQQLLLSSP